jgi:hypothetical protein
MPPESPTNPPRASIGWAPSFTTDVKKLDAEEGYASSTEILSALVQALSALKRCERDKTLISQVGHTGSSFQYNLHPRYVFTFNVLSDRDERKQPD